MENNPRIVLKTLLLEMENHWNKCEKVKREQTVQELSLPVHQERWNLLFCLVRLKKGSMDEEGIFGYLRDYFGIYNLKIVSKKEIEGAIEFLSGLPDKERT